MLVPSLWAIIWVLAIFHARLRFPIVLTLVPRWQPWDGPWTCTWCEGREASVDWFPCKPCQSSCQTCRPDLAWTSTPLKRQHNKLTYDKNIPAELVDTTMTYRYQTTPVIPAKLVDTTMTYRYQTTPVIPAELVDTTMTYRYQTTPVIPAKLVDTTMIYRYQTTPVDMVTTIVQSYYHIGQ